MSDRPIIISVIEGGLDPSQEGYEEQQRLLGFFQQCMQVHHEKSKGYKKAWREQGWMGNVARILSKSSRLKSMLWCSIPVSDAQESTEDTFVDLANLSGFAFMNMGDGNKWGR